MSCSTLWPSRSRGAPDEEFTSLAPGVVKDSQSENACICWYLELLLRSETTNPTCQLCKGGHPVHSVNEAGVDSGLCDPLSIENCWSIGAPFPYMALGSPPWVVAATLHVRRRYTIRSVNNLERTKKKKAKGARQSRTCTPQVSEGPPLSEEMMTMVSSRIPLASRALVTFPMPWSTQESIPVNDDGGGRTRARYTSTIIQRKEKM